MIDFIGDIHGHADKLESLLKKLGYQFKNGTYFHAERKVLFVGDYIDRGPKIKETLYLIRRMVDNDAAIALMGNHEYNALCFHTKKNTGGHLRKHSITNLIQHYETIKQFQNKQKEYEDYLHWFKTLPLFYEGDNFRAVHACWDENNINTLRSLLVNDRLTDELLHDSIKKGSPFFKAIDETLKGKEIRLPNGLSFEDKDGTHRCDLRIKWWENPLTSSYQNISIHPFDKIPEGPLDLNALKNTDYYVEDEKAVFFGHYWLKGDPFLFRNNICCLDYSVAKHGVLAAYRFNNESSLMSDQLIYV